ncbi:MAG: tRNA preQ1(34) S-adenosylmethionine ribosyltransferase-isomerase QueA [Pirellulales bacterium]|nr:tRNA preQ1(34) S-adenosylmethionine ribosyltransferase-isomerase QueA [Pirellulales bacterium]
MTELDQYDYHLPRHLIAQQPAFSRTDARLLVIRRKEKSLEHRVINDLPELLRPGDGLVLNDSKVIAARLLGRRTRTGGHWEGLFLAEDSPGAWRILGQTRGKMIPGETVTLLNVWGKDDVRLELVSKEPDGTWIVRPQSREGTLLLLDRLGRVPLPPYIREGQMVESDREDYQTVYARVPGSVAAPTAGLHFTEGLLRRLEERGIRLCPLTLHVGLGTFRPITAERLEEHVMHAEWGTVPRETVEALRTCRNAGGRIVAVGTTALRLLETAAADGELRPFTGWTDLFIRPPYLFRAADALLTNFHLPRTTLLVLVRTFGGDELIRNAYAAAIRREYRFYSYGDAMLILD